MTKIYFVGAGCGAKDLITVRGMNLLKDADIIIYAGSLVNPELLTYNETKAEIYNSATMTLDEVMEVLISGARNNKKVVRLHTGDPSLYGAIGEQIRILKKESISYEVVPGVSAAFGAAASLACEMTLPDVSQTVILTRMEGKTKVPKKEAIENLARVGATMAIYLSGTRAKDLADKLLLGGYKKDTPVAVCHKATWDDEVIIRSDVEHMAKVVEENNIENTTLFLVGDSVGENSDFELSKLYARDFSTAFRKAKE